MKLLNSVQTPWRLTLIPHGEVVNKRFDPHTVAELEAGGYRSIPATVPGNFELDLVEAGIAPDPYEGQNAWLFRQYEDRHLWYTTSFSTADAKAEGYVDRFLRFEGIDTVADIYLNGSLLGHTENMLIEHEFSVDGLLREENELLIHIFPTAIESRKYPLSAGNMGTRYNWDALYIRKPGHMFGWDIMPRLVSGGIWRSVSLVQKPKERIEQFYLMTLMLKNGNSQAKLRVFFEVHTDESDLSSLKLTLEGVCGESHFYQEHELIHTCGDFRFVLEEPCLWYPRNAGEPSLYHVTVRLWRDGVLRDEKTFRFGIRTVELVRTSTTDQEGNGEFLFKINGKKIFCMGTNWVPLDAFPSRGEARLRSALDMLCDLGCNMVRCWGGNVYERDAFYDFCDEHGIMVWQDFGMACAFYPQGPDFAEKIYQEAVSVIKRLRSHACLVLWAGDNECDIVYRSIGDPNQNILTRKILPHALQEHDVVRPYLPSSPYVDEEAFRTHKPISEDHLWGPRDYFKGNYYGTSVCHFASEIGYHGCPSPDSLACFIPQKSLWPITDANDVPNDDWICHATEVQSGLKGPYAERINLMINQVRTLFGVQSDDLNLFAKESQISQAEADKFFIEHFRLTKWRRTGILWWNLIDGWPQISDAVVDWYYCKKLAYHYIKRSQASLCLMFDEPFEDKLSLYAVNDLAVSQCFDYTVLDVTNDTVVAQGSATVEGDTSVPILSLPFDGTYRFLYIRWQNDIGTRGDNHYITKSLGISAEQYLADIKKIGYDTFEGFEA